MHNMNNRKALFIGRFQPFHKGHLYVIKDASFKFNLVIIGIGSSQYGNLSDNPFSAEEREKMIKESLRDINVENYKIILLPDIHNPPKWVEFVLTIISEFDVVLTNNPLTKKLFVEKGFDVKETKMYNKREYSGKIIRKKMINNENWEESVPIEVLKIIKQVNGVKRLKELIKK